MPQLYSASLNSFPAVARFSFFTSARMMEAAAAKSQPVQNPLASA
ncbi:hypothetical protein [Burkholderia cepacia]|nr:hypothetical protein [Burkholderia cepacia]